MSQHSTHRQELERKRQYWREHIRNWQDSGLSQSEYCRRHELAYHRFIYWREQIAPKPAAPVSIVELPLPPFEFSGRGKPSWPAALRVSIGADLGIDVLPGFDPQTLQQIVVALRGID